MRRYQARRKQKKREKIKMIGIVFFLIGLFILLPIWEEAEHITNMLTLVVIGTPLIIIGFLIFEVIESVEKHNPLDKWLNQ